MFSWTRIAIRFVFQHERFSEQKSCLKLVFLWCHINFYQQLFGEYFSKQSRERFFCETHEEEEMILGEMGFMEMI